MTAATAPPPVQGTAPARSMRRIGEKWYAGYLFVLPHFAFFAFMVGLPFFYNLYISLTDYTFGGNPQFIGLKNFQNLADPEDYHFSIFWNGVWNTVLFVLMSTPLLVTAGLGLAVLVNGKYPGRNVFRATFFVPWTLGIGVVGLLWWWLLNSQSGLLTLMLANIGIVGVSWLTTNPLAWVSINLATLWWTVGFNTIILLAGLQAISPDLYEAASIDGANRWQQFKSVTIPSLRPILLLVITLQVIASFNMVGQSQIMTGGGPGNETRTGLLYMYETGFTNGGQFQLGQAAAMGLIIAAMMVIVSIVNFRLFRSDEG